jgi:hypothetical protein
LTKTTLRRVKEGAYAVTIPPDERYFAFTRDDETDELVASLYSAGGEWISDRGSLLNGGGQDELCIVGDPLEMVADGSLAWLSSETEISAWDVDADVVHTYTQGTGLAVAGLRYLAGYLYWWEFPTTFVGGTDVTVALWRSPCDLAAPEQVGDHLVETGPSDNDTFSLLNAALNTTAAIASFVSEGGEVSFQRIVRITLAAGADTDASGDLEMDAIPDASGTAVGTQGSPFTVWVLPDDLTGEPAERWPSSSAWIVDGVRSLSTSVDRQTALLCGTRNAEETETWAIEAPCTATAGAPAFTVQISDHPALAKTPDLLALMV